jgi:SAM-dependent methyltransferase
LIELIAKDNHCSIIDEYKGFGGGPKFKPKTNNKINFIDCMVGKSQGVIKDQAFDVVFSISVVEHVPTQDLQGFFTDCHRILKPKGIMLHLIDAYVEDNLGSNQDLWKRIIEYRNALTNNLFEPVGEIKFSLIEDIAFRSAYATNPDNMMRRWNISSPTLVKKRMTAQSCTIEMMGRKR